MSSKWLNPRDRHVANGRADTIRALWRKRVNDAWVTNVGMADEPQPDAEQIARFAPFGAHHMGFRDQSLRSNWAKVASTASVFTLA